jgi:histone-lysine N-methyltransferase SETMAR
MLVVFFDDEGIVHREFVPTGTSVAAAFYMDVLTRLRESVKRKWPQKWKNDWALHHYNAVQQFLAKNNIPTVPHPPYSSDLAPNDFWLFPTQKMGLRGRRFATVEGIKENADTRPRDQKGRFSSMLQQLDRQMEQICVCRWKIFRRRLSL